MATSSAYKLSILIDANANGAITAINATRGSAERLGAHLARMGHLAAAALSVQKVVAMADTWAGLTARVALASEGIGSAQVAMTRLSQIADRARVDLAGLAQTYGTLARAGTELGFSQERVLGVTETLAKAMTLSGSSAEAARAAMIQFGQGLQAGTLRGDELNSVLEQAPRLAQALAEGLGRPVGALKSMAEQGQITSDAIFTALERMRGKIDAEFAGLPTTLGQAMTVLQNSALQAVGVFDQAGGLTRRLGEGIVSLARNMEWALGGVAAVALGTLTRHLVLAGAAMTMSAANSAAMRAARLADLQATVAQTEAVALHTRMLVREAQIKLASAQGLGASVVAQNALTAARVKDTAAIAAQTVAQNALNAATSLGARALGLLGGPIGAIATVLGVGAAAWMAWQAAGTSSEKAVERQVVESDEEIVQRLRRQIGLLRERNDLSGTPLPKTENEGALAAAKRYTDAYARYQDIVNRRGEFAEINETARGALLAQAGKKMGEAYQLYTDLADALGTDATRKTREAREKFMEDYKDQGAKMVDALAAYDKEFKGKVADAVYAQDTAAIRKKYTDKSLGAAARDAAAMALERSIGEVERAQAREQGVVRRGLEALDALRDAGLVVETDYHAQRRQIAVQDIATQEALVRRQIAAVQASGIEPKEKLKAIERYNAELEKLRQQGFDVEAADVNRLTVLTGKRRAATTEANLAQAQEAQEARAKAITDYGEGINGAIVQVNQYTATIGQEAEMLALEATQIGATTQARALAIAQLQIELERRRQVLQIQSRGLSASDQEAQIARVNEIAARAATQAASRVQLDEWGKTVEQVDTTFRDGFRAMLSRSEGTWSSYVKSLKNTFKFGLADELYKMFARPFVLRFLAGVTGAGGAASAAAEGAAAGAGGGAMGSLAGGLFGAGGLGGSLAAGAGWLTGATTLGGSLTAAMSLMGTGTLAGVASGLGMVAGALGPIALGLMAVNKLFGSKGGPKQESWSGYSGSANDPWGRFSGSIQSGGSAGSQLAKDLATSITGTVKAALAAVGIAGALTTGVYASQDPKGDSPTQLDVQASLAGQSIYSRQARVGDIENVGRSEAELKTAVARETLEVLLSAIKASGEAVPRFVERLTKDIGDASTADEINSALAAVAAFPDQVLGQLGTSRDTLASAFVEGLKTGDATLAGQTFAATLMVGIQDAMLGNFAQQVTGIVTNSILVPIMDSLAAGATLADAMASANIEQAVAKAQAAAENFQAVWGNADFQAALGKIQGAVQKVGQTAAAGSGFRVQYSLPTVANEATKDADKPEDKARALSIEIARLEGRTLAAVAMQREDELKTLDAASQVLQQRVYALQDEAAALEKTKALIAAFDQAVGSFQTEPERIRYSFERIARDLQSLGVVGEISVGDLAQVLQTTGQDQIAGVVRQFLSLNTVSDDTKIEVLGLVGALGNLKQEAADAERAVLDTGASLADVYQEIVQRAKVSGERVRDALSGITEGYVGAQERVASAQETVGNLARQAAAELRGFAKDIRAFVDDMDSSDLGGQSKRAQLAAAQARFAITSAQARAGDEDALKRLTREAGTVLNLSRETSRSQLAISRNADSVRATLGSIAADQERRAADKLVGIADAQDPTAKALKDLATAQDDLARWSQAVSISGAATERHTGDYLREWREATAEDDAARADLGAAVLTMQGVSVSQTTAMQRLSDAIAAYTAALLARDAYTGRNSAVPGPVDVGAVGLVSAGGPRVAAYSDSTLRQYIDAGLAQGGEAGARAAFSTIATSGRSLEDAAALYGADAGALRELAKSLGIPGFAVGTNFVPRDMLALVHQGEAIVPRPFNPAAHGAGRDADGQAELAAQMRAMAEQIRALSAEVVRLRQDNSAENLAIAKGALESAARLRKLDAIGIADRVAA